MQHHVGHVEHVAKEVELAREDVESEALGFVVGGEEVDDGDIALLAIAVAAADALFDALRVPGQVVVHHGVAKLQVKALGAGLGADHHRGATAELIDEGQAHGRRRAEPQLALTVLAPYAQGGVGAGRFVYAAEEGDVFVAKLGLSGQEALQVILGGQRLGEHHHLAAVCGTVEYHAHRLDQARGLAVVRKAPGAFDEALHQCELVSNALLVRGRFDLQLHRCRLWGLNLLLLFGLILQVIGEGSGHVGSVAPQHSAQAFGHAFQASRQRGGGGSHATVEAEQQQLPGAAAEGVKARRQQIGGDIVVQRSFGVAHAVFEQPRMAADEGLLHELLRLPPQRALHHGAETPLEFFRLLHRHAAPVVGTEDLLEHGLFAEQRAGGIHVLHESPKFAQRVLDRRCGEEQHRRCADDLAHPVGSASVGTVFTILPIAVVAAVDAGEHLVRLVDEAEVKGRRFAQAAVPSLAAGILPAHQEDPIGGKIGLGVCSFNRFDAEQERQLVLPLPKQRSRHDDEDAGSALRHHLGDDQPRLNGLAEPHFVRKDATPLRDPLQREHHRVNLMRIRIHPSPPLRRDVPPPLPCSAQTHQVLGVIASMDGVHGHEMEV